MSLFEAFQELSNDRSFGMGVGPIPGWAIRDYAAQNGFDDPDDFELLRRAVRAMDRVYMDDARDRAKQASK